MIGAGMILRGDVPVAGREATEIRGNTEAKIEGAKQKRGDKALGAPCNSPRKSRGTGRGLSRIFLTRISAFNGPRKG
jgi:hypothetical protein